MALTHRSTLVSATVAVYPSALSSMYDRQQLKTVLVGPDGGLGWGYGNRQSQRKPLHNLILM